MLKIRPPVGTTVYTQGGREFVVVEHSPTDPEMVRVRGQSGREEWADVCHFTGRVLVAVEAQPLRRLVADTIRATVEACGGNVAAAARSLGIAKSTLHDRLKRGDKPRTPRPKRTGSVRYHHRKDPPRAQA